VLWTFVYKFLCGYVFYFSLFWVQGWPWTCDPLTSASQVLGLQVWATMPGLFSLLLSVYLGKEFLYHFTFLTVSTMVPISVHICFFTSNLFYLLFVFFSSAILEGVKWLLITSVLFGAYQIYLFSKKSLLLLFSSFPTHVLNLPITSSSRTRSSWVV
jgi:hypothetical protein